MSLRYPWWARLYQLQRRSFPGVPFERTAGALATADWFTENHAEYAEKHGWQPAHIMKPQTGLAWRWWSCEYPSIRIRGELLTAAIGAFNFVYRREKCGNVTPLLGIEAQGALVEFNLKSGRE